MIEERQKEWKIKRTFWSIIDAIKLKAFYGGIKAINLPSVFFSLLQHT